MNVRESFGIRCVKFLITAILVVGAVGMLAFYIYGLRR